MKESKSKLGAKRKSALGTEVKKKRLQASEGVPKKSPKNETVSNNNSAEVLQAGVSSTDSKSTSTHFTDLLEDKFSLVESLFSSVGVSGIQDLIPDNLKGCPIDELKTLCLTELKKMSSELILHILSGKDVSAFKEPIAYPEVEKIKQCGDEQEKADVISHEILLNKIAQVDTPDTIQSNSSDALELFASAREVNSVIDEENQEPIEDEVPISLAEVNKEAEILELEMRARAIRSLLKAKDPDRKIPD